MSGQATELPEGLRAALAEVCRSGHLLVASDFDGVLAPFVIDPMDARAQRGTLETLAALAALPRTGAALVSGRDLETLGALTGLDGTEITLLGSHGAQSSVASGAVELDAAGRARLLALTGAVHAAVAARAPTVRLEAKPAAVVLHTRGLGEAERATAEEIAVECSTADGVRLLRGKDVRELTVSTADKGSALLALAATTGVDSIVYLGDDLTDEHVFEVARPQDVTIKVGDGVSAAGHRVDRCEDVPQVLELVLRLRGEAVGG